MNGKIAFLSNVDPSSGLSSQSYATGGAILGTLLNGRTGNVSSGPIDEETGIRLRYRLLPPLVPRF